MISFMYKYSFEMLLQKKKKLSFKSTLYVEDIK